MTDTTLDNILSGGGETAPASGNEVEKDVTQVDQGAAADGQTNDLPADTDQDEPDPGGQKQVPLAALHAERQKAKRYTEQVAEFQTTLKERDLAWERRFQQLTETLKPKQESAPPADIFDKPDDFVRQTVGPQFDHINQTVLANARLIAEFKFGDDKVAEAESAFINALQGQKLDPADYHKVVNSPNRYAAAMQWYTRQQAQAEIGEDPAAYKARVEAEIKAKYGITEDGQPPANQQRTNPVMPSNLAGARNAGTRSGPAWAGPQPIADIFKR